MHFENFVLQEKDKILLQFNFPKQALVFTCPQCKSFKNTVEKGEIAHKEQFLLYIQRFLPV